MLLELLELLVGRLLQTRSFWRSIMKNVECFLNDSELLEFSLVEGNEKESDELKASAIGLGAAGGAAAGAAQR